MSIRGHNMVPWTYAALVCFCSLATSSSSNVVGVDGSVIFKIRWKDPITSQHEVPDKELFESVRMMSPDKEPFMCYIPRKFQSVDDKTEVKNYRGPTPMELLDPLFSNKVCRYKLDSYWTYQLCHGRSLRQYHEDTIASKVAIMEFYLGKSDAEHRRRENELYKREMGERIKDGSSLSAPTIRFEGVEYPYFAVNMSYGTLCDINQKSRSTQVLYICDEYSDHDIHSFEETSSCMYRVIVRTPLICRHPKYRVTVSPENEIACHPETKETDASVTSGDADRGTLGKRQLVKQNGVNLNQPIRLQEMEKNNREFRRTAILESEGGYYDNEFKRNLKIFFLHDEDEVRTETLQHDEKHVQSVLSGDTCLTGGTGWWRYEFCYGKRVTQYHLEKNEKTQEILLGRWDEAKHRKWVNANSFRKVPPNPLYVNHFYSDGDMCAVTGKPRTVEVKLTCKAIQGHPDAVSIFLQEPKACEYKLTVESTLVCRLLSSVDEDGLPELLSPANGHRPRKLQQDGTKENQEDSKKDDASSATSLETTPEGAPDDEGTA